LSGGGYRAALFHLGALRRLNELGVLGDVESLSTVSGGSIVSAHLAQRLRQWPRPGEQVADWDARVGEPLRAFCRRNIRTAPFLKRTLPWNWFGRSSAVDTLAVTYQRHLTDLRLRDLPDRPDIVLCSTDMSYGVNWVFSKTRVGDFMAGYLPSPGDFPLGRAVAASSCFPPVFNPMRLGLSSNDLRGGKDQSSSHADAVKHIGLTDGGVYDNMGLEPVWKSHRTLLVSDGGAPFHPGADQGLLWRLQRYTSVVSRQAGGIRRRWLVAMYQAKGLDGCYWGIRNHAGDYDATGGYSGALAQDLIARIRTDLDVFSEAEQCVLENHGYVLADRAVARYAAHLAKLPTPFAVPHPEWLDERRVRTALADSHRVKLPLGRW